MRRVSAKISSNNEVPAARTRDNSVDPPTQPRHGASAYIDQSEYDAYRQPTTNSSPPLTKPDGANRGVYSNYPMENSKTRYVQDAIDDDYPTTVTNSDYSSSQQQQQQQQQQQPQHYTKNPSTTSYSSLLNRSNSYNGMQSTQGQPRVISAKQRNTSGSSLLYQVDCCAYDKGE